MRISPCLVLALVVSPTVARAQATVTVDAAADAHSISPLIYGVNFASVAQVQAGNLAMTRWGGNGTSRYNYRIDVTNTGADYFFENVAGCWNAADKYCAKPPVDPQDNSGANAFLDGARKAGIATFFTVPTIGWVAKAPAKYAHPFDCGCPRTGIPQQDDWDQFDANCGNGRWNGVWVQCPAATTTSMPADTTFASVWLANLTTQFGHSNGNRIYELDNEPALWSSTHHDIRPMKLDYDELWQRMRDYALAILQADATAAIAGPVEWGWPNYFCSDADDISKGCSAKSPDRAKHGGEELIAWLLDQAAAYEKANNKRVLHYLDLHYYPQGGAAPENARSLWDPSYTDPSWINDKIRLIPRMHDWVNQHYPGTRIAISEYDFGHHNDALGLVTYAEVLGIFGREALDAATAWSPPAETEAAFGAYKLYRNYDGNGGRFEDTNARATVSGAATVKAYGAAGPGRATVALVNEANAPVTLTVVMQNFNAGTVARWFVASNATVAAQPDVPIAGGIARVTLPAQSIGMLVEDGENPMQPVDMAMYDGAPPIPDLGVAPKPDLGDAAVVAADLAAPSTGMEGGAGAATPGCACSVGGRAAAAPFPAPGFALAAGVLAVLRRRRRA